MIKELNIRIFRQRWPATTFLVSSVWKMFCVLNYATVTHCFFDDLFLNAAAKMVVLGGFFLFGKSPP